MATDFGTDFADAVYEELDPVTDEDQANGFALRSFVRGGGQMFEQVNWLAEDSEDGPGWSRLVNLANVPDEALPWLGQFVGVTVDTTLPVDKQRSLVASASGWRRGTPAAIIAAAQATLTGTKLVTLVERNGDAYNLSVVTKGSETPDPAATLAALRSQVPGGILLLYQNIDGQLYLDVYLGQPTYQSVFTSYATYNDLLFNNQTPQPPVVGRTYGSGTYGSGTYGGS